MTKEIIKKIKHKRNKYRIEKARAIILGTILSLTPTFLKNENKANFEEKDNNKNKTEILSSKQSKPLETLAPDAIADALIEQNLISLENFELKDYTFSKEELEQIKPDNLMKNIEKEALKIVKKGKPKQGEQTYCFRYVKSTLKNAGNINLTSNKNLRHAYQGIEVLKKDPNFVKINFDIKDSKSAPNGLIAIYSSNQKHKSGHAATFINGKDVSDYSYNIVTRKKYGEINSFVSKKATIDDKKLLTKLVKENKLKKSTKLKCVRHISQKKLIAQNYIKQLKNRRSRA